jgi:hypothetical protein
VDLKVLALVYTLECELKGSAEHIKTMPLIEDKKDFPEVNSSAFDYKRTESYSNYKNYKKEPIQQVFSFLVLILYFLKVHFIFV